jgi:hypothetical protein
MFLFPVLYPWNSENTISETPSEVTTSATVGQIESSAPISIPLTLADPVHPGLGPISSSHANKLFTRRVSFTSSTADYYLPLLSLAANLPFLFETSYYVYYQYKAIKVRATISAPKSLTGFMSFGWFPLSRQVVPLDPDDTFNSLMSARVAANVLSNLVLLRADTKLLSISEPIDVEFTIPWTYPFSMLLLTYPVNATALTTTNGLAPLVGEPVLYTRLHSMQEHTTAAPSVNCIFTMEYVGLRCFGRQEVASPPMQHQSFTGAVADMAMGFATKKVSASAENAMNTFAARGTDYVSDLFDQASDVVCEQFGYACDEQNDSTFEGRDDPEHTGTEFTAPLTTMPSIIGDTLSSLPSTSVSLRAPYGSFNRVPITGSSSTQSISSFLRRPQLLTAGEFNSTASYNGLIVRPPIYNQSIRPNWFGYFAQISRYWRGSLRYHFVFAGHPFIECRFAIAYSPVTTAALSSYTFTSVPYFENQICQFSGSKTFSVLVPYSHPMEYLPVDRGEMFDDDDHFDIGSLRWQLQVINSAFEVNTVLSYAVYVSAGPDFTYYDATPPGYSNVQHADPPSELSVADVVAHMDHQISLPGTPDVINITKGFVTADPGLYKPLRTLKQVSSYWSRVMWPSTTSFRFPNGNAFYGLEPASSLYEDTWPANNLFSSVDYVGYLHAFYLYWRGSMGFKTVFNTLHDTDVHQDYAFVTLGDPVTTVLTYTEYQPFPGFPLAASNANWGSGTIVTKVSDQPTMEFTLPMRHNLGVSFVHYTDALDAMFPTYTYGYIPPPPVHTNLESAIILDDDEYPTEIDLIYRKVGKDFECYVETLLPYPSFWASRGFEQI